MNLGFIAALVGVGVVLFAILESMSSGASGSQADAGSGTTWPPQALPAAGGTVDLNSKVQQFAQAISVAEGFGVPGAVPTVFHNPGDLGPGDCGSQYPASQHSGSMVSQLPDDATGWGFLINKIHNIFTGQSGVYSIDMTILQFAGKYAGDAATWANNVASVLGVSMNTKISDWLYS